jgi:hypothetical protein
MEKKIDNDIEVEINQKIINKRSIKKRNPNNENFGQLTREQFELMKKIRDEAISRTERYTELTQGNKSNDEFITTEDNKKKKIKLEKSNKKPIEISDNINTKNNSLGIININTDIKEKEEIDPNKDRIFKGSQAFLFYKGEPLIIIGPDTLYYVWIFSLVSFLCIIIYNLKDSYIILKLFFIISYLFFATTYTLLLVINPGIPTNKSNLDPTSLQKDYKQCPDCNCISLEKEGKYTIHCEKCKICVEHFDHHCTFATKCIGRGNKIIFKMWMSSIPILFVVSFFYLLF